MKENHSLYLRNLFKSQKTYLNYWNQIKIIKIILQLNLPQIQANKVSYPSVVERQISCKTKRMKNMKQERIDD